MARENTTRTAAKTTLPTTNAAISGQADEAAAKRTTTKAAAGKTAGTTRMTAEPDPATPARGRTTTPAKTAAPATPAKTAKAARGRRTSDQAGRAGGGPAVMPAATETAAAPETITAGLGVMPETAAPHSPGTGSGQAVSLAVLKTYKLYIGGKFPRSESGRTYPIHGAAGGFLANAAQASRKDARDAVVAARKAFPGWSHATAYNRGQVIYRIAEMLDGRATQFTDLIETCTGIDRDTAARTVAATVDRLVHYAGWTDKIAQVFGSANPVAGPYFSFTTPEPTGVVAAFAPQNDPLLGLVSVIAPIIASGNTAVIVTSHKHPLPAVTLAEVLATSDMPAGVVNILTGDPAELGTHLATHADINALDLTGTTGDLRTTLARDAAGTVKRVYIPKHVPDFTHTPGTTRLTAFLETKTVWHPTGPVSLTAGNSY